MGFLDHSTNNVILDAVLTDKGRELLSMGQGNFQITSFAFADDEVDYSIIKKFGRTVGKEKIEKNTPVLEASTGANLGIKYPCVSLNDQTLQYLPNLALTTTLTNGAVVLYRSSTNGATSQALAGEQQGPAGFIFTSDVTDFSYQITCDNTFLLINGYIPDSVDGSNVATYTIPALSPITPANLSKFSFSLVARSVPADIFDTFSHIEDGTSRVSRYITVKGMNSGQSTTFQATIF